MSDAFLSRRARRVVFASWHRGRRPAHRDPELMADKRRRVTSEGQSEAQGWLASLDRVEQIQEDLEDINDEVATRVLQIVSCTLDACALGMRRPRSHHARARNAGARGEHAADASVRAAEGSDCQRARLGHAALRQVERRQRRVQCEQLGEQNGVAIVQA